jgi:hypothetical protein
MGIKTFSLAGLIVLAACATRSGVAPREYMDETTAATITVVAKPWVFVEAPGTTTAGARDFLNVYAIDVNRSGDHRQYLAVLQWWPHDVEQSGRAPKTLNLQIAERTLALDRATQEPRKLGIAQPLDTTAPASSQWLYFPVDKQVLQELAAAQISTATLAGRDPTTQYTTWKEARAEVEAFTTTLR